MTMLYDSINLIFILFFKKISPFDLTGRDFPPLSLQMGNIYEIIRSLAMFVCWSEALEILKELDGHNRLTVLSPL